MDFKKYLIDTFLFNDQSNRKLLKKIALMKNPEQALRLFNHLSHCQFKWLARIQQDPNAPKMDWWFPEYSLDEAEGKWVESLTLWLEYLGTMNEKSLMEEIEFIGAENNRYAATPGDIALQLNYHSIHHRAQIASLLRDQGITPDFSDYIGTRYRLI